MTGIVRLGVRFDVDKVDSAADYGGACWEVLWTSIDAAQLLGARLYEGDTRSSMLGKENVFCIALQADPIALERVRTALQRNGDFGRIAADRAFVESAELENEPLPDAGRIVNGEVVGGFSGAASAALMKVRNTLWTQ